MLIIINTKRTIWLTLTRALFVVTANNNAGNNYISFLLHRNKTDLPGTLLSTVVVVVDSSTIVPCAVTVVVVIATDSSVVVDAWDSVVFTVVT